MFLTTRNSLRDPALAFFDFGSRIHRLLNDGLGVDWPAPEGATSAWVPAVDVFEQPESIRIAMEVPGVTPEDVKISLEGNVLTVRGTKHQVAEERTERVHRYERVYGAFERSFTLPATVDATGIKANYQHGVLTVTLPKVEKARPKQIEVQVTAK